jgi:hypothetical protein
MSRPPEKPLFDQRDVGDRYVVLMCGCKSFNLLTDPRRAVVMGPRMWIMPQQSRGCSDGTPLFDRSQIDACKGGCRFRGYTCIAKPEHA